MRTYAIMNRKGGVGKTTTAAELAYDLAAYHDQRVLLIDADSQANATSLLLGDASQIGGVAEVLEHGTTWYPDVIAQTDLPGLDILPANEALGDYELECTIGQKRPRFDMLRDLMEALELDEEYDRVVIDCPPYYSVTCIAALSACDTVIIPAGVDAYSATGMTGLLRQIDNIRVTCPNIRVGGVLVTQYHRADVAEDALTIMRESSPVRIFDTVIRRTDKAVESSWARQTVDQWSPWSAAARDYRAWVNELLALEVSDNG